MLSSSKIVVYGFLFSDNVCIDSMSVKINKRTVEKAITNVNSLEKAIMKYVIMSRVVQLILFRYDS